MRTLLFIVYLIVSEKSFGQDKLDAKISKDACTCLSQTKKLTDETFVNCFQKAAQNNSELIAKECFALYGDTTEQMGYKFGQALFGRISVSMVFICPSYISYMDTIRFSGLPDISKDSISKVIIAMNHSDTKTWDKDFYTQRGVMHFQVADLDNALKDFNSALSLDKNSLQSIYFKAWTLEIKKNYDEAYSLYDNLATLTNRNEFKIFAAMAKQKKSGL